MNSLGNGAHTSFGGPPNPSMPCEVKFVVVLKNTVVGVLCLLIFLLPYPSHMLFLYLFLLFIVRIKYD